MMVPTVARRQLLLGAAAAALLPAAHAQAPTVPQPFLIGGPAQQRLGWKAGAGGLNAQGKPSGRADVDPIRLRLRDDTDVDVIGNAVCTVSPSFQYGPKAGHVANRHGRIVARYIAERPAGRERAAALPDNVCFMMVNGSPREAVSVLFDCALDAKGEITQQQIDDSERHPGLVDKDLAWVGAMYEDMLG